MSDDDSYELEAVTVYLMQKYADGEDMINHPGAFNGAAKNLSDFVYELDDYTKGLVIIDLLTMNNILMQTIRDRDLPLDPYDV